MSNPTIPIWIDSPTNIQTNEQALELLKQKNDLKFWTDQGALKVTEERWKEAQKFERTGWLETWAHAASDRQAEHSEAFEHYRTLPYDLGDMLEIGCGPFTQSFTILDGHTARSVTLQDPLIYDYRLFHPNCTYKDNAFRGRILNLLAGPAEGLWLKEVFDTIVCINVLEHVQDVKLVMDNIYDALKPNGILIFGERDHDDYDPNRLYDIGHPIRMKSNVILNYAERFHVLYNYDRKSHHHYFIGQKWNITQPTLSSQNTSE